MVTNQSLAYSLKPDEMATWDASDLQARAVARAEIREQARRFAMIMGVRNVQLLDPTGGLLELVTAESDNPLTEV